MSLDCSAGACAERQRAHASPSKIKISSKRMLPQKNIPRDWDLLVTTTSYTLPVAKRAEANCGISFSDHFNIFNIQFPEDALCRMTVRGTELCK